MLGATGKHGEVHRFPAPASVPVDLIVTIGLGAPADVDDADKVRQAAGIVARSLDGLDSVATTLSDANLDAAAEGFFLRLPVRGVPVRQVRAKKAPPSSVTLLVEERTRRPGRTQPRRRGRRLRGTGPRLRQHSPSHLYPEEFADRARVLAGAAGLKVEILDDAELARSGYGGIIGVGRGSSRFPRLVRLTHNAGKDAKTVALVGRASPSTPAASLKPPAGMENMTSDMGGAAAVIASTILAARLGLDVNVIATVPMAENMPSDTAQRPAMCSPSTAVSPSRSSTPTPKGGSSWPTRSCARARTIPTTSSTPRH